MKVDPLHDFPFFFAHLQFFKGGMADIVGSPPPPSRAPPKSPDSMMNGSSSGYSNGIPQVPEKDSKSQQQLANIVRRKLTGYVGFANLPNQWHRKSVRKGFNFNVMVVGIFPPPSRHLSGVDRVFSRRVGIGEIDFGEYFV